ncbi:MAG: hypothetical protein K2M12_07220 [Muribaculaceae bacterium]|nr:hypothetical protein [Muribaculaceae bacterium]
MEFNFRISSRFEYFLNAVLYCLWRWELKGDRIIKGLVYYLLIRNLKMFVTKRIREKLDRRWRKSIEVYDGLFCGETRGVNITLAKNNLLALWTGYTSIFMFVPLGVSFIILKNMLISVLVAVIVGLILDGPIYKNILNDYQYIEYFRMFELEDEYWHKKWNRKTILICFGALLSVLLSGVVMFVIMYLGRSVMVPR